MRKTSLKRIEVEFRSMFSEKKYKSLKKFLDENARKLGRDNKDVYFFTTPNKLFKVVNNITKRTAKMVLKLNRIGKGNDFEEIEVPFSQKNVEKAAELFTKLGFADRMIHSFQRRFNYLYKDVELALKYSPEWQYHLELEILINDLQDKKAAVKRISEVAEELGVKTMTEKELRTFVRKVESQYKENKT